MDFERLFDEHYDKVYVYISRRVNNPADAEDLTADVFYKAFAYPYDPKLAKFSTYIYTIAGNVIKNHYRYTSVRGIQPEPDENLSDDTDITEDLITREEYDYLLKVLKTIPGKQYDVIYRRYFLEQSFREIGEALGITEVYARKLHERSLDTMRKKYQI